MVSFVSVQSISCVRLFATPWFAARQASLSITNSRSLLKLMPIELVMPSSHLILCRPLLLLPPVPPSIRVFSNESTLCMRWPKYWIHCIFETSSVTDYWQKFFGVFFFFFFSVMPVRAPNLTMQCAQIQINHHYAGLWTGHDFHPELPSFATCSKVCTDASEMEWASVGWKMVPSSIKMAMARVCSRVYFLPLKTFLK